MLGDLLNPDLFASAIRLATPIALAAIAGTICERSGIVNIALEGIMLIGAFFGVAATLVAQTSSIAVIAQNATWIGVASAVLAGVIFSAIHAFGAITLRMDHVVSGTALNIMALGLTGFILTVLNEFSTGRATAGASSAVSHMLNPVFDFTTQRGGGPLATIWYWIDGVLLSFTPIVYVAMIVAVVAHWAMYRTRWGLRLRALGEHPKAADSVGVRVIASRYAAVLISGALGGLAGANLSLEQVGSFSENMTTGRGFIALAANIFGRWTPIGSYLASLLFGFGYSLQLRVQGVPFLKAIPVQFFLMFPYVLTVVVLAGFMGRAVGPAAVGKAYEKE